MKEAFESCLIDAVKRQPVLYDRNAVGYNNKEDVENAWIEVTKDVSKTVKNINVTHCKLRWRTLRDRFVKQIAKTADGTEHFTPEAKRWEYTNQLSFLSVHLKKRKCEESFNPNVVKKEPGTIKRHSSNSDSSRPQSFSFVESKSLHITPDSSRSHFLSESDTLESEFEPEIDMPQPSTKRQKIEESEFPLESFEIEESVLMPVESSDMKVNVNEDSLTKLLSTTNELLQQQIKQNARKSPNEAYFQVLDGFFSKLPPNELDRVKVEILNLILMKKRNLMKRH